MLVFRPPNGAALLRRPVVPSGDGDGPAFQALCRLALLFSYKNGTDSGTFRVLFLDMVSPVPPRTKDPSRASAWVAPILFLCAAYALLGLTFTERLSHHDLMQRCVLMDPNLSRIWSVANIEIGLSYFGVFVGMVYYFLRLYRHSRQHLIDLGLASAYVVISFALDYACVLHFKPFVAMLIGDAVVMTFTLAVSRQVWFQRLLGVFVPIIFITCSFGHFMEGLSYWHLTYPLNVPWTMVTADCGFAVLVNSARFPGLIRGEDVLEQLTVEKARVETERVRVEELEREITGRAQAEAALQQSNEHLKESERQRLAESQRREGFARDVMLAVTGGRLRLHSDAGALPAELRDQRTILPVTRETLAGVRRQVVGLAERLGFGDGRQHDLVSAVSETLMNAVVHGGGGEATVSHDDDTIQVRVSDGGTGLDWESLPYATLQTGWSSKGTLGMGFTLMALADTVDILTGPQGTTIVLTMGQAELVSGRFALA